MNFENRLPGILGCLHICRIRLIGSRSCLGTHVSQPSSSRLLAQVRSSPLVALQESNNPGPVHKIDVLQARFLQRCAKPSPPSLVAKRGRQERRGKICKMTPPLGQPAAFVCSHYALPIHRAKCDKRVRLTMRGSSKRVVRSLRGAGPYAHEIRWPESERCRL